jgi:hypothetical protein
MLKHVFITSVFLLNLTSGANAQFAGGDGTLANPYQISNVTQLQAMRDHLNSHFILINNIDATETAQWNDGAGFEPIGRTQPSLVTFNGSFNGDGFIINRLTINRLVDNVGLFGVMFGNISNVGLENVSIRGLNNTGALAANRGNGTITNSYSTGTVTGSNNTGGLVGRGGNLPIIDSHSTCAVQGNVGVGGLSGTGSSITNSHATGNVTGFDYVGGLIGEVTQNAGTIADSYATGSVTATGSNGAAGGLVGRVQSGLVLRSHATGDVTGSNIVGGLIGLNQAAISQSFASGKVINTVNNINARLGGLVGYNDKGRINDSYATGDIEFISGTAGGLVGLSGDQQRGKIIHTYSTGRLTGGNNVLLVGGLIGSSQQDTIRSSYWNTQSGGVQLGIGTSSASFGAATGLTTTQMQLKSSFQNWDFSTVWDIDEGNGFPFLRGNQLPVSVEDRATEEPASFRLLQNYPNPFNPSTVIRFAVGSQSRTSVHLSVYDAMGREIAVLINEPMPAGEHSITFDASTLASGVYLIRLVSGDRTVTNKMTLVR